MANIISSIKTPQTELLNPSYVLLHIIQPINLNQNN